MTAPRVNDAEIERLARTLARSITGADPDAIVVPEYPPPIRLLGFIFVPQHGRPLWTFFETAACAALDELVSLGKIAGPS